MSIRGCILICWMFFVETAFCLRKSTGSVAASDEVKHLIQGSSTVVQNTAAEVFALKGEPVEIACQSPSKSKPSGAKSRAIWLHGDKPVASGGRFQVTSSGNLKVSKPIIKDTGEYTCKTKTHQGLQSQIHHVKVYTRPEYRFRVHLPYKGLSCDDESGAVVKIAKLRKRLCAREPCAFTDFSPECISSEADEQMVTFELAVEPQYATPVCSPQCIKNVAIARLKKNRRVLHGFLQSEIQSGALKKGKVVVKLEAECEAGSSIKAGMCVPCPPGTFSDTGEGLCTPCDLATYSAVYGASECKPCANDRITPTEGASSEEDCVDVKFTLSAASLLGLDIKMLSAIGVGFIIIVILIVLVIKRLCRNKKSKHKHNGKVKKVTIKNQEFADEEDDLLPHIPKGIQSHDNDGPRTELMPLTSHGEERYDKDRYDEGRYDVDRYDKERYGEDRYDQSRYNEQRYGGAQNDDARYDARYDTEQFDQARYDEQRYGGPKNDDTLYDSRYDTERYDEGRYDMGRYDESQI